MDRTMTANERVRAALESRGLDAITFTEFAESTATAADAAAAIGTTVGRIVKSLVFMVGDEPILVLASGTNRVDPAKLGHDVRRANAGEVRQHTSFVIGGVPPVGHPRQIPTYVDEDLLAYEQVWASAGTPNSVFPIEPRELVRISGGRVADVRA
jgi:prolyl-tRNA editing enzyme YbaK/EbsC (Cys-tRNA(Pro) deacylase)